MGIVNWDLAAALWSRLRYGMFVAGLLVVGCPSGEERPQTDTLKELEDTVREIENLRADNRSLRKEMRDTALALKSLRSELQAAKKEAVKTAENSDVRVRALTDQVRELERELEAAGAPPFQASDDRPDPGEIARIFLSAVRRRDRKVIDSIVDYDGLLEEAVRDDAGSVEEAEFAVARFRALDRRTKSDRVGRARSEFLRLLESGEGPEFSGDPLRFGDAVGGLRYRVRDADGLVHWSVLLSRRGGSWKVVGLVREAPPVESVPEEPGIDEGEGEGG